MLLLASASPRRQEILRAAGIPFTTCPVQIDESPRKGESPQKYVRRLAEAKARAAVQKGGVVLGADTVVVAGERMLGKPLDRQDAARMLRLLSGRTHQVITGICLLWPGGCQTAAETTVVKFIELSDDEIGSYVDGGEPADKAGAYAIQGGASKFVERIEGCYFNVVGLPMARVYQILRTLPANVSLAAGDPG